MRYFYGLHQIRPLLVIHHDGVDIEIGSETTAQHRIDPDQPLSASSRFEHVLTAHHGARNFVTRGVAEVTADASHYHVQGALRVLEDGAEIFSRDWSRKIPRKYA